MAERRKKSNIKSSKARPSKKKPALKAKKVTKGKAKKVSKAKSKSAVAAPKEGALSVYDLNGKALENLNIDALFSDGDVNTDVLYQAIIMYQAGEREGTASTKNRGDVRGGGKKPWKQKGTGQARHGSRRSPIWRGGGVTFGPSPRDYSYAIPAQIKRKAVIESVKEKVSNSKLFLLKQLDLDSPKTKIVAGILKTFKFEKPLFLVEKKKDNLILASRNIPQVSLKTADEVNALDVVSSKECVMTKAAYQGLLKRLKS